MNGAAAVHGTRAGYLREIRAGGPACEACREANRQRSASDRQLRALAAERGVPVAGLRDPQPAWRRSRRGGELAPVPGPRRAPLEQPAAARPASPGASTPATAGRGAQAASRPARTASAVIAALAGAAAAGPLPGRRRAAQGRTARRRQPVIILRPATRAPQPRARPRRSRAGDAGPVIGTLGGEPIRTVPAAGAAPRAIEAAPADAVPPPRALQLPGPGGGIPGARARTAR